MNQKDNNGLIPDIVHIILFPADPPQSARIKYNYQLMCIIAFLALCFGIYKKH